MAGWDQRGSSNTNRFYQAEELSPEQWSQLQARMYAPEVRAEIEAIQQASYQRRLAAGRRGGRIENTLDADQQAFANVYRRHGIQLPNGYNVSPQTGEIQFANETPFLQQALRTAPAWAPMVGAQLAPLLSGAGAAGGATAPTAAASTLAPLATTTPSWGLPSSLSLWAGGLPTASAVAPAVASTVAPATGWSLSSLAGNAWDGLSGDKAQALGNVLDYGVRYVGGRRAEGVLEQDKLAADARYQTGLDLLATQRAEDLQLDAKREAELQARWQAQQDQQQTMWDARETRLEPYRAAGQQSLARLANRQTPTRTPYRSRYMG
jgi:hypothetical protein